MLNGLTGGVPGGWRFRGHLVRHIFDASPDGYMVMYKDVIVDCNDAAVRMAGYGHRNELIGLSPEVLDPEYQPDGEPSAAAGLRVLDVAERNGHHRFEWLHRRKDGTPFHASVTLIVCRIGGYPVMLSFWQDIGALVAARSADAESRQAHQAMLRRLSTAFSASVRGTEAELQTTARQVVEEAGQACALAADTRQSARNGTDAVGVADTAAESVAAAAVELSSSITEISRQLSSGLVAADTSRRQVDDAERIMGRLDDAAQRIEGIVDLIHRVAGQTNLLALNATIEAARAGEAGRGFAVVATEVKTLAGQTAKATEDINAEVARVQEVTRSAVSTTRDIVASIGALGSVMSAIAAAVEQQRAATAEISRVIQHVKGQTGTAAAILADCTVSADAAYRAADTLRNAVANVEAKVEDLSRHTSHFMRSME